MAEQNKHNELPIVRSGSQQKSHRRAATLDSVPAISSKSSASVEVPVVMHSPQISFPESGHGRHVSHDPGKAVLSGFKSRGKDWESLHRENAFPVQSISPLFDKSTLKKTGMFSGDTGLQPNSSEGTSHQRSQLASPLSHAPKDSEPKSAPPLVFSVIKTYLHQSPVSPTHGLNASSPVSAGDQSVGSTLVRIVAPASLPSPDHSLFPKYVSAFDYAMRPFLDALADDSHERLLQLPLPTHQVVSSPRLLPLPDAADAMYDSEEEDTIAVEETPEYGIPAYLWETDAFQTRMQQTQLNIYLMHCTTLQGIIDQVQREPWKSDKPHSATWYYGKMVSLAYKARTLAEALKSHDLQARCEYWAGRGCGGSRDYGTAEKHLQQAILLDVPNDSYKSGRTRLRGLLPKEKADVRFLLDSCHKRAKTHQSYERRMMREMEKIRIMADDHGLPLDAYSDQLNHVMPSSPPWVPDRDRLVGLAKAVFEKSTKTGEEQLGRTREKESQMNLQTDDEYVEAENRRRLTRKEWAYIKHGDVQAALQRDRQMSADRALQASPKSPSGRSPFSASSTPSLALPRDLADELEGLGYEGDTPEASPSSVYSRQSQGLLPPPISEALHPSISQTLMHGSGEVQEQRSAPLPNSTRPRSLPSSVSTYQSPSHELRDIELQHSPPPPSSTSSRPLSSSQEFLPITLEQQPSSVQEALPFDWSPSLTPMPLQFTDSSQTLTPIVSEQQQPTGVKTQPLSQHSSLSTSDSDFYIEQQPFPISQNDYILATKDYDYTSTSEPPQASSSHYHTLQERRRGKTLRSVIPALDLPPRSNRRPYLRQAQTLAGPSRAFNHSFVPPHQWSPTRSRSLTSNSDVDDVSHETVHTWQSQVELPRRQSYRHWSEEIVFEAGSGASSPASTVDGR